MGNGEETSTLEIRTKSRFSENLEPSTNVNAVIAFSYSKSYLYTGIRYLSVSGLLDWATCLHSRTCLELLLNPLRTGHGFVGALMFCCNLSKGMTKNGIPPCEASHTVSCVTGSTTDKDPISKKRKTRDRSIMHSALLLSNFCLDVRNEAEKRDERKRSLIAVEKVQKAEFGAESAAKRDDDVLPAEHKSQEQRSDIYAKERKEGTDYRMCDSHDTGCLKGSPVLGEYDSIDTVRRTKYFSAQ
ncbi:hypothetical protein Tco_0650873 [Tanacetum coccineum]